MICPGVYNPIYSSSNSFWFRLYLYITVRRYSSFGLQSCSMKANRSSQCLTSLYEAWSSLLNVWPLLPFGTQRITMMKVVFGNSGRLTLSFFPTCSPKFVASRSLRHLPFFLASRTSLVHFFKNLCTQCSRMYSALSKYSTSTQVSKVSKKSATTIFCAGVHLAAVQKDLAPDNGPMLLLKKPSQPYFLPLVERTKVELPILLSNCIQENSICFKLIGAFSLAPPKSDKSSLS